MQQDFRCKSPRAYIPFDSTSEPGAKYFKERIMNSFPELEIRVNFLNKFYQCLMAGRMPHKVKKLVVHGPKDSGKTSWINVLIPISQVASITQECQFAASMIEESTQLVILDEWSENTLHSDMAKSVLQGGFMVKSVKHQTPKCINNTAPFYITTNILPNFGAEDINVQCRIVCFETTSLQATATNADKWMHSNCMHCITCMIQEIEQHKHLINEDELWYEASNETSTQGDNYTIGNARIDLLDIEEIRRINKNTLSEGCSKEKIKEIKEIMDSPDLCLHEDYSKEAKRFF